MAAGWAYDLGLKSSPLSVLPYVVCFGLLPTFVVLALPGAPAPVWWLPLAGALLGAGAHFANVLPDLDDDAATGVRGLPHRLGRTASRYAAAVLLLAATVVLAAGSPVPAPLAVAVPVAGRAGPGRGVPRRPAPGFAGPVPRGARGGRARGRAAAGRGSRPVRLSRRRISGARPGAPG